MSEAAPRQWPEVGRGTVKQHLEKKKWEYRAVLGKTQKNFRILEFLETLTKWNK